MKLTNEERQGLVAGIIANCDCWKAQGDDRTLNTFSDEKLITLKEHIDKEKQAVVVANAAVNGFSDGETAYRINPETSKWERRVVANAKKKAVPPVEDDEEEDEDDEDEAYTAAENEKRVNGKKATANARKPRTNDEWMRSAPQEIQEQMRYAEQIVNREKAEIIQKLLVNVAESDRQAHRERLQRRSLEDLHGDLSLVPKQTTQDEIDRVAGAVTNRRKPARAQVDDDMLEQPTMNWVSVDGQADKKQRATANVSVSDDEDISDEEWLKTAPPRIRQAVHNATAVESRERRRLIDELVANFQGTEDQEQRLLNRLNTKSVEELRDLQSLSPRQEKKSNFFGSSAPTNNLRGAVDVNEDVLPLPQTDWKANAAAN